MEFKCRIAMKWFLAIFIFICGTLFFFYDFEGAWLFGIFWFIFGAILMFSSPSHIIETNTSGELIHILLFRREKIEYSSISYIVEKSENCVDVYVKPREGGEDIRYVIKAKGIANYLVTAYEKRNSAEIEKTKRFFSFEKEKSPLYKYFKSHYKIDLDVFIKEASKNILKCTKDINDINYKKKYWEYEYSRYENLLFNEKYYAIIDDKCDLMDLFQKEFNKDVVKIIDNYKNNPKSIDKYMLKNEDLLYVEYIEDVYREDWSNLYKKPSKIDLAMTEELFGTAAAINKAINANAPKIVERQLQYYKFVFKENNILYMPKSIDTNNVAYNLSLEKSKEKYDKSLKNDVLSPLDEIKKAKKLYDEGILTEEEFNKIKKKLIDK